MIFVRPKNVTIVEMCIYVDEHMKDVVHPGENSVVEDRIVQYLYFIIDSLAKKQSLLPRFSDYEEFALYGASELFISMRNKYMNAGKVVRGKEVQPVKSCLNFIKSVLYPLKVNFQKASYDYVINPEIGQNTDRLAEDMRENIRQDYQKSFIEDFKEVLKELPKGIYDILYKTPYKNDPVMIKKLYMSCVLSFINSVTLPNKIRNRIENKNTNSDKVVHMYSQMSDIILLWHLEPYMRDYVYILLIKIKRYISDELGSIRNPVDLSDEVMDSIMRTAFTTYDQDMEAQ